MPGPGSVSRTLWSGAVVAPTLSALVSFIWILSRSAAGKSARGRISIVIAGTLIMMVMFVGLLLPAIYVGLDLSNKLRRRFPDYFYRPY